MPADDEWLCGHKEGQESILELLREPDDALLEAFGRAVFPQWDWDRFRKEHMQPVRRAISTLADKLQEQANG